MIFSGFLNVPAAPFMVRPVLVCFISMPRARSARIITWVSLLSRAPIIVLVPLDSAARRRARLV